MNPITTEPTSPFIISTLSGANFSIDRSSNVTYTATAGTIGNLSIVPSSFQVSATATYVITYGIMRAIRSGSTITVIIPSQISLSAAVSFGFLLNNATNYTTISPSIATINGSTELNFSGIIVSQMNAGTSIKI